jgi:hypothetical protein
MANELTLRAIRDWVGDREIAKGRPYAEDTVSGAVRVGDTLKANVQGTRDRPYRVRVELKDGEVAGDECSCPVGDHCKHVAAVLLAYLDDPSRFAEVDDLDATLRKKDKAELVALIKLMVRRAPELESILAAPVPGFGKAPADPKVYRRQALDVIRGMNPHDEWAADETAEGLEGILDTGRAFEDAKDFAAAAAVYQGVAAALAGEEIDYLEGTEGDLAGGLIRCLDREPAGSPRRESFLRSLFDLLRAAGSLGFDEDGDGQFERLLAGLTAEERRTFSGWLMQSAKAKTTDAFGAEYESRRAADLLLRVNADVMDDEAYLAHCRRFGMRRELVTKLLELGRTDDAVKEVAAVPTNREVLSFSDLLVSHRLGAEAEQLLRDRKGWDKDTYTVRWLLDRAAARKDAPEAARLTARLLDLWPSLDTYLELKKWTPAADWPAKRAAVLGKLEKQQRYDVVIDVALNEGDVGEALRVMKLDRHGVRKMEVANAAEATHPAEAIAIYRPAAERVIENRDRGLYADACKLLKKVGTLMAGLGKADEFRKYVVGLAEKYRALRAFQEELRKAKLVEEVPPTAVKLKGKRSGERPG